MRKYLIQFHDHAGQKCSDDWRKVKAESLRDAAIVAMRRYHVLPPENGPLFVNVASAGALNRHPNGMPICVHVLTIQRSAD